MPQPSSHPTVLLVEDSADDAFFFQWTLQKSGIGCDFTHVDDGGLARDHLAEVRAGMRRRPDVVFLDLKLPTLSGFEILSLVRQQDWQPPLRVIVLSGSEHEIDVTRATQLGAYAYFVKPVSRPQLEAVLLSLRAAIGAAATPS